MTRQKNLKALVRDRMARTGETYTTARRHVTAHAAEPGTHAPSTLVRDLLARAGVVAPHTGEPFTEAMLAGLGGGIGFLYAVFEYKGYPHPTMTIVAQHHPDPFVPAILDRLGCVTEATTTTSAKVADRRLAAALAANLPLVSTVDRSALPWLPQVDPAFGDPYPVSVVAADDDTVHFGDGHSLPRAEFAAGWAGRHKHAMLTVTGTPTADLPDAIRSAVATTVGHLTGPVLGHSFDTNFGLSGMDRLADALGDRTGRKGWTRLFATSTEWVLNRLHDCLEREYTAPGATRPLYADFLAEAAPVVGEARYTEAADLYRAAGARWSAVATRALGSADGAFADLHALVEPAIALEREAVAVLRGRPS
ncbi:hypothetical protein [Alloactinosynnema sp. L-07]|uniref:DUF4872 domain-containing protein n=1 Tax=Alloactinosynnema sp. L-07 TaxID=1653480 RepID=UPI00065EF74D|nr:DUF4872 domain-containing protein [Alloactinosynnema sp. L-07]CRK58533.1 hypothetical protein [Alloactinosynnema sp. L-07]